MTPLWYLGSATVRAGHLLNVALNPTDWKRVANFIEKMPRTVDLDVAGRLLARGGEVSREYKVGDRVAGFCYGINADDPMSGAFSEYTLLKGCLYHIM